MTFGPRVCGPRVVIIGASGSGKSTLAQTCSARMGVEVVDLDRIHWLDKVGTQRDENDAKAMVAALAANRSWVIEGVFGWLAEVALPRASSLVWLDLPWSVCREGLAARGPWRNASAAEHADFLEWAEVFGNYYGTAVSALDHAREAGKDLLLDIDVQGALQVMKKLPEAVSIFILPPSPEVLEMRLRNRSEAEQMTSETVIERRLSQARNELEQVWGYKYALVNDVLDQAVAEMRAIVLYERGVRDGVQTVALGCRTGTASAKLQAALGTFER